VGKSVGILLMTTPQGVVESNLRGESKNRFFDSMLINSPLSRHFVQVARTGSGRKRRQEASTVWDDMEKVE